MRETAQAGGWVLWAGVVAIIVAILLAAMAVFGFGLFKRSTADFRGTTDQIEQTRASGSFRIQAYDRFYDRCAGVQADEATIKALLDERANAPDGRKAQINATLTAVRSARAEKIAEYNADARKVGTIGQFRAIDLPGRLDATDEETTCEV